MNEYPVMIFEPSTILDLEDLYLSLPEEQHSVLRQLEDIIRQQSRQIQFDSQVFNLLGVDKTILTNSFSALEQWRNKLKNSLESPDESVQEQAISLLSEKVTETLMPLLSDNRFQMESKQYEDQVKEEISIPVWEMLAEESRKFLVTAHFTFDQLSMFQQDEFVDYSCVCMLVTKALELETTTRYFDGYIHYLQSLHIDISRWPYALLKKNSWEIIDRNSFSLGSVVYTAGLKNISDTDVPLLQISHRTSFNNMCDYYRKVLLKSNFKGDIKNKVMDDCSFVEVVRVDYRNPSAHKNSINRIGAQNCLDYILTVEKKMFHMLKDMRR